MIQVSPEVIQPWAAALAAVTVLFLLLLLAWLLTRGGTDERRPRPY